MEYISVHAPMTLSLIILQSRKLQLHASVLEFLKRFDEFALLESVPLAGPKDFTVRSDTEREPGCLRSPQIVHPAYDRLTLALEVRGTTVTPYVLNTTEVGPAKDLALQQVLRLKGSVSHAGLLTPVPTGPHLLANSPPAQPGAVHGAVLLRFVPIQHKDGTSVLEMQVQTYLQCLVRSPFPSLSPRLMRAAV
jgi:hypothetical protein